MNSDETIPDRFLPSEPRSRSRSTLVVVRWMIALIVLVALVTVAYQAYFWFVSDAAQHPAAANDDSGGVAVPPPVEVPGLAQSDDTQDAAPGRAAVADLGNVSDPDQRRSICGYLAAESERLGHDFKQPLPPPVIDRIATETAQLRAQINRYGCMPGNPPDSSDAPFRSRATPAADD
ncbi:MAG: hypothetical protein LBU72_07995 [Burkholderiaceae bacterium]|jgi:hypothetical protein|nr:hypothetical protein [Burkholderiaceae bacterium]